MAEVAATIGLVSSIITLVEVGQKIATRLHEFAGKAGEVPESFRSVAEQIPLLLVTLERLRNQADSKRMPEATAKALRPMIDSTLEHTTALEAIVAKTIPDQRGSMLRRRVQALKSLMLDDDVQCLLARLNANVQYLLLFQTTSIVDANDKIADAISNQKSVTSSGVLPVSAYQHVGVSLGGMFVVPFRHDRNFIDTGIIADVEVQCDPPGAVVALVGLGGTGKSQIAIEFAYRMRERNKQIAVFWVHAGSSARLRQDFLAIAEKLQLPELKDPQTDVMALVSRRLSDEANTKWLLIIDNADDPRIVFGETNDSSGNATTSTNLRKYLPINDLGTILVTTRSREVAQGLLDYEEDILSIGPMAMDHAVLLLERNSRMPKPKPEESGRLLEQLGCLPLAISQAALYINQRTPRVTVATYSESFQKSDIVRDQLLGQEFEDTRRDPSAANSVFSTWQISFEHIREVRNTAADLLAYMSMFDRVRVPEFLLKDRYSRTTDEGISTFEDDIALLRLYDLVSITDEDAFTMHALVQLATRRWLISHGELELWQVSMVDTLDQVALEPDLENWKLWSGLVPHIQAMQRLRPHTRGSTSKWTNVLRMGAEYLFHIGRPTDSERLIRECITGSRCEFGEANRETLRANSVLASILWSKGKREEAKRLAGEVLADRLRLFGRDDFDTVGSFYDSAVMLEAEGQRMEAQRILEEVVNSPKYVQHTGGPDMLKPGTIEYTLAYFYVTNRDLNKANTMSRQAVEVCRNLVGDAHPSTLLAMRIRALVLGEQHLFPEAEKLMKETLKGALNILGPDHPETLLTETLLCSLLIICGRQNETQELAKNVLERTDSILGPDHPATYDAMNTYGLTFKSVKDSEIRREWLRQALEGRLRLYAADDQKVLSIRNDLANVSYDLCQYDDYIVEMQDLIKIHEEAAEPNVRIILSHKARLGDVYRRQGRLDEALQIQTSAVKQMEALYADLSDHLELNDARLFLALTLAALGHRDQAEPLFHSYMTVTKKIFGSKNAFMENAENSFAKALAASLPNSSS